MDLKDIQIPQGQDLIDAIFKSSKKKNTVILAHYYQPGEIQDIADYLGDSLQLARTAKDTDEYDCVFVGFVHFMAESCKILNPTKKWFFQILWQVVHLQRWLQGEGLRKNA